MSSETFTTRSRDVATFIHFVRPDLLTAITKAGARSTSFEFAEPSACAELQTAFYGGAGVDDARALLARAKELKDAAYKAMNDPEGVWLRDAGGAE